MKSLYLLPLATLSLSGCAALGSIGLTPASAPFLVAVAAELRAGANVIRANAAGNTLAVQISCFRIRQARIGVDGTIALQFSENVKAALAESRWLTESVCIAAGVPAYEPLAAQPNPEPLP